MTEQFLDGHNAGKKFLKTFPVDVEAAEQKTGGDPDILKSFETEPKEKKKPNNWSDIFVDPSKAKKKIKESPVKGRTSFLSKSDHEVRFLEQKNTPTSSGSGNSYTCSVCNFTTVRLNVLILHNKTHTKEELKQPKVEITPKTTPVQTPKTNKKLRETKQPPVIDEYFDDDLDDSFDEDVTPKSKKKKKVKSPKVEKKPTPKKPKKQKNVTSVKPEPKEAETKTEVKENEITKNLLADWSDDELTLEDVTKPSEPEPLPINDTSPTLTLDDLKNSLEGKEIDTPSDKNIAKPSSSTPVGRTIPKKQKCEFLADILERDEAAIANMKIEKLEKKNSAKKLKGSKVQESPPLIVETKSPSVVESKKEAKRTKSAKNRAKETNELFNMLKEETEELPSSKTNSNKNKDKKKEFSSPTPAPDISNGTTSDSAKHIKSSRVSRKSSSKAVPMYQLTEISPPHDSVESQIAALLDETAPPVFEPKLPPKERNKRKRISKTVAGLLPKLESPAKTESEMQIAETLTQLPQTAIQFSPSKEVSGQSNLPVKSMYENPRKRPLRALDESSKSYQQQQQEVQPLAKIQKSEVTAVIPKKRKLEYTAQFEEHIPLKITKTVTPTKASGENNVFDIEKMEIVYYNDNLQDSGIIEEVIASSPTSQKLDRSKEVVGSPSKSTSSTKVIEQQTKTETVKQSLPTNSSAIETPTSKIIQRPSSVAGRSSIGLPPKVTEVRRLSSPLTTSTQRASMEAGIHKKTLKFIIQPDGSKKFIEKLNKSTTPPPNTQKVVLRASSSSPLAKYRDALAYSKDTSSQSKGKIEEKGKLIQKPVMNKFVITSKGQLITTTSPGKHG